jgi:hypothetical protein
LYTATALRFGHDRGDETRYGTVAMLAYAPTPRLTFQGSAGATFEGVLRMADGEHAFKPGVLAAAGVSYRLLDGPPFVMLTSLLSGSAAATHLNSQASSTGYEAFDLRVGAVGGITLFDVLSPYVLARTFGGPVFWHYRGRARIGTDVYHYQLGGGLALRIAKRVEILVEGVPLGEQAITFGAQLAL